MAGSAPTGSEEVDADHTLSPCELMVVLPYMRRESYYLVGIYKPIDAGR